MTSDMPPLGTPEFKTWWAGFITGVITRRVGGYRDIVYVPRITLEGTIRLLRYDQRDSTADELAGLIKAHKVKP